MFSSRSVVYVVVSTQIDMWRLVVRIVRDRDVVVSNGLLVFPRLVLEGSGGVDTVLGGRNVRYDHFFFYTTSSVEESVPTRKRSM